MSFIRKCIPGFVKTKIKSALNINNTFLIEDVVSKMAERKIDGSNYSTTYKRFEGKVVIITGATGSIGKRLVEGFAFEGAHVIACGRNSEKLNNLLEHIKCQNLIADGFFFDITKENEIVSAFDEIFDKYKSIDVLINCAGGSARENVKPLAEQNIETIDDILSLNLRAPIICCKLAGKYMINQNRGSIINFSSLMGTNGKEGYVEYGAAKAGILGLTKGLAKELGKYNINVNAVTPSYIPIMEITDSRFSTLMNANYMNTVSFADDIYNSVAFLASEQANFITGQNIIVDGGRSLGLKGD